jgi:PKHD-type hydroxylase
MTETSTTFNENDIDQIQDFYYDLNKQYIQSWTYTEQPCFNKEEIENIILIGNLCLKNQQYAAEVIKTNGTVEKNSEKRICDIAWLKYNKVTEPIYHKLSVMVNEINSQLFQFDLSKIETLQFTKYSANDNGFYCKHIDIITGNIDSHHRKLSFSIQLSDPSDYEGGDLLFHTCESPEKTPKDLGTMIMFPSYTLHEVTPVTKGTRYSLVGWVHGNRFK